MRVDAKGRPYSSIIETKLVEHKPEEHHEPSNGRLIPTINITSPFASTDVVELQPSKTSAAGLIGRYVPNGGKFCYCSRRRPMLRSESIKVDNWDYIYTERRLTNER